jgi:uncharacterized protein YndB with AHSA1/START domain
MTNLKQKTAEQPLYGVLMGPETIKFERVLPGPVERVWEYLTDSDKRSEWFAAGPMDLKQGGEVKFKFDNSKLSGHPNDVPPKKEKADGEACADDKSCGNTEKKPDTMAGKILQIDKPRLLKFTFMCHDVPTEVQFELEPRGKDTLLRIIHSKLSERNLMLGVTAGWQTHVGILADKMAGVKPQPFWTTHAALMAQYEKVI